MIHLFNDLAFGVGWLVIGIAAFLALLAVIGCITSIIVSNAEDRTSTVSTAVSKCPCGEHEAELSGVEVGPWWPGDSPQPVYICPNGRSKTEGYLYVKPGTVANRLNWIPVWAVAEPTNSKEPA